MAGSQPERQFFGFGRTSTFSRLTMPASDSAERYATGPTTSLAFGDFHVKAGKKEVNPANSPMNEKTISFGPFRLIPAQRLLLEGDQPVRLGSRAFDILATLVERPGEVIGKDELKSRIWPKTFVEDANLKIQVSALRRALGDGQGGRRYIATIPGRGYNFVAPVRVEKPQAPPPATIASAAAHNLPFAATR